MRPIRSYEIKVDGFPPALYSARSSGKARARCWRDYTFTYGTSFKRFLTISTVRLVPDPPGVGERILVAGLPATRVYHPLMGGGYVWFMRDDSDVILSSHPADVAPLPASPADAQKVRG